MPTVQTGEAGKSKIPSCDEIAAFLTSHGWTREVADEFRDIKTGKMVKVENFDRAVKAIAVAFATPRKGLIVSGEYGCGKTSLIKALTGFHQIPYAFDMNDRMAREYLNPSGGYSDGYRDIFKHGVLIDDLGAEVRKHFGENDYSEARDFICEYHLRGKGRFYMTTNHHLSDLMDIYGGRLCDRLKDLGVPLMLRGGSKRTWSTK